MHTRVADLHTCERVLTVVRRRPSSARYKDYPLSTSAGLIKNDHDLRADLPRRIPLYNATMEAHRPSPLLFPLVFQLLD